MKLSIVPFKNGPWAGQTVRQKEGSERASLLVQEGETRITNVNGSIFVANPRTAAITLPASLVEGKTFNEGDDLNIFLKSLGLGEHKIIMIESIEPFYEGQDPKTKGGGGEVITDDNGNAIYQDYRIVPASSGREDERVARGLSEATNIASSQEAEVEAQA
jgi:hypothetical protein